MQYRLSGEALHLDVDTLNEQLQLKGAERMRTAMRPDEAFGMIFSWEGVVADMHQVNLHLCPPPPLPSPPLPPSLSPLVQRLVKYRGFVAMGCCSSCMKLLCSFRGSVS